MGDLFCSKMLACLHRHKMWGVRGWFQPTVRRENARECTRSPRDCVVFVCATMLLVDVSRATTMSDSGANKHREHTAVRPTS